MGAEPLVDLLAHVFKTGAGYIPRSLDDPLDQHVTVEDWGHAMRWLGREHTLACLHEAVIRCVCWA